MTGELAALAGALGWAISSVMVKPATARVNAFKINAVLVWMSAALALAVAALAGRLDDAQAIPAGIAALLAVAALLGVAGDLALLAAIATADVGRAFTTATSLMVLFSVLGGRIFLGNAVPGVAVAGAAAILAGVYLANARGRPAGAPLAGAGRGRHPLKSATAYTVYAGVLWSANILVVGSAITDIDPVAATAVSTLVPAAAGAAWALFSPTPRPWPISRTDAFTVAGSGLAFGAAIVSFMFAIKLSDASITAILVSSSPLFAAPLAALFLKERLTRRSLAGVLFCIVGVFAVVSTS